jgi:hypothetical protein
MVEFWTPANGGPSAEGALQGVKMFWVANIPAVFIAIRKKGTPRRAKVLAVLAVAYALSPIDLIPTSSPFLDCSMT